MIEHVFPAQMKRWAVSCAVVGLLSGCGRIGIELVFDDAGVNDHDANGQSCICENPHGSADCSSGQCQVTCSNGYADCDGNPQNGCESSVADGAGGCGGCTTACENPNGTTSCMQGVCVPVCAPQAGDCDGDTQNGCEEQLSSVAHCGACDSPCSNTHGTTACAAGMCMPSCEAGYDSCDNDAKNGCEARVASDPMHCGDCVTACDTSFQVCMNGTCQVSTCPQGSADCDANTSDCETTLGSDTNCGFCGDACSAANGTAACAASACTVTGCNSGFGDCDTTYANGCEVPTDTTVQHCGRCNNPCVNANGSTRCTGGACVPTCTSGFGSCDGNAQNGCETPLDSLTNCGMCGRTCTTSVTGATPVCSAGACTASCLNGVYALRLAVNASWSNTYIVSDTGTLVYWARMVLSQTGSTMSGTVTICGVSVPDFRNSLVSERYGVTYAASVFEQSIPAINLSGSFTSGTTSSFALSQSALLMGTTLADPVNSAWPSLSTITGVDHDNDGFVGVTLDYKSSSGYTLPPTTATFFPPPPRASKGDLATRVRFQLGANLTSCTAASGNATVSSIEQHTMGCRLSGGGNCSNSQYSHLDQNDPQYAPQSATFSMSRLGNTGTTFTCAAVRAALP